MTNLPTSIKELKSLIAKAGLSSADCFDKVDLVNRAKDAMIRLNQAQKAKPKSSYGGFMTKVVQTKPNATSIDGILMILHGFGATNSDFVPMVPQFAAIPSLQSKNLLCIFPQAPSGSGMPSWWDLSTLISAFTTAMATQKTDAMGTAIRTTPNGLIENRQKLLSLLEEICSENSLFSDQKLSVPLVIGGFSQGAMTALDLCLNLEEKYHFNNKVNLMKLSGAPICVDKCQEQLTKLAKDGKSVNVFMSHGKSDFVIPVIANSWSVQLFKPFESQNLKLTNILHNGSHDLGGDSVLKSLFEFVGKCFT